MRKICLYLVLLGALMACDRSTKKESEAALPPLQTLPSYLSFRVNFPVGELEDGVNRVLPKLILDDALPLKGKGDTLFLKVERKGKLNLAIRKNEVFASIPLDVEAGISKKVLGVTFSNADAPVKFSGLLKASATVGIDENWDMNVTCEYKGFDLGESSKISIMGMTFNVEGTIDKALEEHEDQLSDIICGALNKAVDFRGTVEKVWMDLQKPQRIAKRPQELWLYSNPVALNGTLVPLEKDTLSVHVEFRTKINISPIKRDVEVKVPLTSRGEPLNTRAALLVYPEINLPYDLLSQTLKRELAQHEFTYEAYKVRVTDAQIMREGQKLKVKLTTTGDLNGIVYATGRPVLNEDRELVLEGFAYEIDADDEWVAMTDWAVHEFAERYVAEQVRMDMQPFLEDLDELIMTGLDKSHLAEKLDLQIGFDEVTSYQLRLTEDAIQWIFYLEGWSQLNLKKGLFKNRD